MKNSRTHALPRWAALTLAGALAAGLAAPAAAQWKWIDKQGRTQYSDLPPPRETPPRDILQRPNTAAGNFREGTPASAAAASAASGVAPSAALPAIRASEPELETRLKKAAQEAAERKQADESKVAAAKAENCTRAKAHLRTLDSGVRVARANDKGEREIMDDAARTVETRRAREVIASDCR